jgi:hypothetical protein
MKTNGAPHVITGIDRILMFSPLFAMISGCFLSACLNGYLCGEGYIFGSVYGGYLN